MLNVASVFIALILCFYSAVARADDGHGVGNGGDAIEIGGALRVFDHVEFEDPFFPDSLSVWPILHRQLQALERKLPKTGAYMRRILTAGQPMWYFVDVALRDIQDEGRTTLYLTVARQQIAANTGAMVQIHRGSWNRLNDEGKATLIFHEALWTAIGRDYLGNGSGVRRLARILMNTSLERIPAATLSESIRSIIATERSPLSALARVDSEDLSGASVFDIREIVSEQGPQTLLRVTSGSMAGMEFTPLKSNPRLRHLHWHSVANFRGQAGWETIRRLTNDFSSDAAADAGDFDLRPISAGDVCGGLVYGGSRTWRLPTSEEMRALVALHWTNIRFPQNHMFHQAWSTRVVNGRYVFSRAESGLMFPGSILRTGQQTWSHLMLVHDESGVSVLGSDGRTETEYYTQVSGTQTGFSGFIEYICVRR